MLTRAATLFYITRRFDDVTFMLIFDRF